MPWLKRITTVACDRRYLPCWVFAAIVIALLLLILCSGVSIKHMVNTIQKRVTLLTAQLQFPSSSTTPK
jgi:putative Ca2+/H+ antiporter (TMEM165/GDT1 family)